MPEPTANVDAESPTPTTVPSPVIYAALIIGLWGGFSFRVLTVLDVVAPNWVRPVWYSAVIGYLFFFGYRFLITQRRRAMVLNHDLIGKVRDPATLAESDRKRIEYVLRSITRSRENINYLFIFVMSIVAIALDVWLH